MWHLPWLVALGGCQLVFPFRSEDPVVEPDAMTEIDAPDPAACPDDGPPMFTVEHTFIEGTVTDYSPSPASGRAFAFHNGAFAEGPIDSTELIPAIVPVPSGIELEQARLAPDGTELFVIARQKIGIANILLFRGSQLTWQLDSNLSGLPMVSEAADVLSVSAPTTGARRMIAVVTSIAQAYELAEFVEDGKNVWVPGHRYDAAALGILSFTSPSLSEDGLRLVVAGNAVANAPLRIYYAARDSRLDRFPPVQEITTVFQNPQHPYLTPDCGALYVVSELTAIRLEP
jgi:hypothetical protein